MPADNQPESIKIIVDEEIAERRADNGLNDLGIRETRSQVRKLFDHKLITINGHPIKPSRLLALGEEITITLPVEQKSELEPYNYPLEIIHEDEDVIVVNKPSGLVVHPACGHKNDTLINALIYHQITLSPGSSQFRPGLVHRIDKDTSGLLVLAKNEAAHTHLAKQFERKTTHRKYEAIVFSHLKEKSGTITSHLVRSSNDRKKFTSTQEEKGKRAVTHYSTLREGAHFSLLELQLETGRTHQIRVHLSSLQHPIVGDDTYGGKKRAHNLASQKLKHYIQKMERFALHAKQLGFVHPKTKEQLLFTSDWPEDMTELFELTLLTE